MSSDATEGYPSKEEAVKAPKGDHIEFIRPSVDNVESQNSRVSDETIGKSHKMKKAESRRSQEEVWKSGFNC